MAKTKIVKCKGFEAKTCKSCKRYDKNVSHRLVDELLYDQKTEISKCIHFIKGKIK